MSSKPLLKELRRLVALEHAAWNRADRAERLADYEAAIHEAADHIRAQKSVRRQLQKLGQRRKESIRATEILSPTLKAMRHGPPVPGLPSRRRRR